MRSVQWVVMGVSNPVPVGYTIYDICQPHKEAYLKSEKVNFQQSHYSSIPGAQICRGKELRDGHLNFHRRDTVVGILKYPVKYDVCAHLSILTTPILEIISERASKLTYHAQ